MTAPYLGPYGLEPDSLQCADCGDRPVPVDHNGLCELCAAVDRHPAGTGIPARLDERYDPSPEPIDRSIQ